MNDIKADTSLYSDVQDRVLAVAECIKAMRAGKAIQSAWRGRGDWSGSKWEFDALSSRDYRVKPEPVETKEIAYDLYVPKYGDLLFDPRNLSGTFRTRSEALDGAARYLGSALVDQVYITYHDGKEVSRERIHP